MTQLRGEIANLWDEYMIVRNNRHEGYIDRVSQLMNAINIREDELSRLQREYDERWGPAYARGGSPVPE